MLPFRIKQLSPHITQIQDESAVFMCLVQGAITEMESRGIWQWDEVYPAMADFALDIEKETLYMALSNDVPVGIYVISTEADEAYKKVAWKQADDRACILHRLCVLPTVQNQGVG